MVLDYAVLWGEGITVPGQEITDLKFPWNIMLVCDAYL